MLIVPVTMRCSSAGTNGGKIANDRCRWPLEFSAITCVENPYRKPAMNDERARSPSIRPARKADQADRAGAAISSTLTDATGPAVAVTGHSNNPSSGTEVFHIALTPWGALIQVLRNGEWPWLIAYGVQPSHQVNSDVSGPPIWADRRCLTKG